MKDFAKKYSSSTLITDASSGIERVMRDGLEMKRIVLIGVILLAVLTPVFARAEIRAGSQDGGTRRRLVR